MDSIIKYFDGEKMQCIIGAVISLIFIAASVYFLFLQKSMLKGMAYSFLPLSLFLLVICAAVIVRTPKDVKRVTSQYQETPDKIQTKELPRMQKVMKSFAIIKKVELGIFLIGVLMVIFFWNNGLLRGTAIGLIVQGALLYLFDHLAEQRGEVYLDFLTSM